MLLKLTHPAIQQFIRSHEGDDLRELVLRTRPVNGIPAAVIANQINCRRKAREKLPLWYSMNGIIYPPAVNLEQSSSETTARYKTEILHHALRKKNPVDSGVDLTAGFGVDSFFLSGLTRKFHHVEPDADLLEIAQFNHNLLGKTSIHYHQQSADEFLSAAIVPFDFIYIDPSRRNSANKKLFRLRDCEPDVVRLLPALITKADVVLIKTSPLLDIQRGVRELASVSDVFVISVENECKEVLFLCRKNVADEPLIHAIKLNGSVEKFVFKFSEEKQVASDFSKPQAYIYEPNACFLKSGAFKLVGSTFHLAKLHRNTHLYTSDVLHSDFPGRIFSVKSYVVAKNAHRFFPSGKANVITRNYPLTAEALKKKLKLKDGGEDYLIAATGASDKRYLLAALRLK
ncbi:hypothetical protein QQ054_21430 [Oscillatoria amoena NRMC-F 0135]|nr:hypothetical protein [Oscillatoria amoena NRMC-F 0135]